MAPTKDNGTDSHVGAYVPTGKKNALLKLAHARSGYDERVTQSDLLREALNDFLEKHWDELPEEAKDDLDVDLEANAGGAEA